MSEQPTSPSSDDTTTQESNRRRLGVSPMAFSSSSSQSSTTAPTSAATTAGDGLAAGPDWTESSDGQPETPETLNGSSQGSSAATTSRGASRRALADAIAVVLDAVTTAAHTYLTDEIGKEAGLYLADEQDKEGISKPAAAVLSRRGVLDGAGTDATDFVQLGIALAGYASKQLRRLTQVRKARKSLTGFGMEPADPELAAAHG